MRARHWVAVISGVLAAGCGAGSRASNGDGGSAVDPVGNPGNTCSALTLAVPAPLSFTASELDDWSQRRCAPGETDANGALALPDANDFQPHDVRTHFLGADGSDASETTLVRFTPVGQASGFLGMQNFGAAGGYAIDVLDAHGNVSSERPLSSAGFAIQAADPRGGLVAWETASASSVDGALESFDASGQRRWRTPIAALGIVDALGVDANGNALLLAHQSGSAGERGLWVDAGGAAMTSFNAFASSGAYQLYPRVGGGLFAGVQTTAVENGALAHHDRWLASFDAFATSTPPAPDWLATRADTTLRLVHGGSAYAIVPIAARDVAGCTQSIDVVTAEGASCGTLTFSFPASSCDTGNLSVGADGTVIQVAPEAFTTCASSGHCACSWRFWPALLR